MPPILDEAENLWAIQNAQWREGAQIASQWDEAVNTDPRLLQCEINGDWWGILAETQKTLLVTREYEHLIQGFSVKNGKHIESFMRLPHPSGLVVDEGQKKVYIASTRNPNQIYSLAPVSSLLSRLDSEPIPFEKTHLQNSLVPQKVTFYPGCLYMHDLGLIDNKLYANSVGQNMIIQLKEDGRFEQSWWPLCVEKEGKPLMQQNYIQLNSIAVGKTLEDSYFSASTDQISARRPGHKNFIVDKKGVVFSGKTRLPIVHGLTRPHSARLYHEQIFVDNSGYGELIVCIDGKPEVLARLQGWTRGLTIKNHIAFVGTSRVLPKFTQYAPGVDHKKSVCGIHAIDIRSGKTLASIFWPYGNQIFSIELISNTITNGFPNLSGMKRMSHREKALYYTFNFQEDHNEKRY